MNPRHKESQKNPKKKSARHAPRHTAPAQKPHHLPWEETEQTEETPDEEIVQEKTSQEQIPPDTPDLPRRETAPIDFSAVKAWLAQSRMPKQTIPIIGEKYIGTGIPGIDQLFDKGIPKASTILIVGGPGSGKTIFCLQTLYEAAKAGQKVLYMTLEETPDRLRQHMKDFGWDIEPLEQKGLFVIQKFNPLDITRQIDAMLEQVRGELLIDLKPLLIPAGFEPDRIALDSLSAVAAALFEKEESYRLYLEQLFKLFNDIGASAFLISETPDPVLRLSTTGVEEFLADGVFVFYNVRSGNIRESAFEVLKMRGSGFKKKIVAMQIKEKGIVVYPEQEVFTQI